MGFAEVPIRRRMQGRRCGRCAASRLEKSLAWRGVVVRRRRVLDVAPLLGPNCRHSWQIIADPAYLSRVTIRGKERRNALWRHGDCSGHRGWHLIAIGRRDRLWAAGANCARVAQHVVALAGVEGVTLHPMAGIAASSAGRASPGAVAAVAAPHPLVPLAARHCNVATLVKTLLHLQSTELAASAPLLVLANGEEHEPLGGILALHDR